MMPGIKSHKTQFTVIGLAASVFILFLNVEAADSDCLIEQLVEKGHYKRGDVNNDGRVNWDDLQAMIEQFNTSAALEPYNPADVNGDGQVNYDDEGYLRNYLARRGPPPCVENVQYCAESPCIVRIGNEIVELRADRTAKGVDYASWLAKAYNADWQRRREIARYALDINYGQQTTTIGLSYERRNSLFGLPNISRTTTSYSLNTPYSNAGVRGDVDELTVLMGLTTLITARDDVQPIPGSPSGCKSPVNIPGFFLSEITDDCFVGRDFCYQRGGSVENKKGCDDALFNCLGIAGVQRDEFWCGSWVTRKEYVKELIRVFNASSFRYHEDDWACFFHSKGKDIDCLLDQGTLTQDCSSCEGKDTCGARCMVDAGGMPIEYPCRQRLSAEVAAKVINFGDYAVSSYGGSQDSDSSVSIEDSGVTLYITGNGWKEVGYPYAVTDKTVLEFDFKSNTQGDIHGIGFDVDDSISADWTFKLYGTQGAGIEDFNSYESSAPEWKHYKIPVGRYYQGDFSYLFFVNDHDVDGPTAESLFRNVLVYEDKVAATPSVGAPAGPPVSVAQRFSGLGIALEDVPTVYEDAEDGTTSGWYVYDARPSGAEITNVYDNTRGSRVISLNGSGTYNGFRLRNPDSTLWNNAKQFTVEWSMKYAERFDVYLDLQTTAGRRYIHYIPNRTFNFGKGRYIHHSLGRNSMNGTWQTFRRNLQEDLNAIQRGVRILEVNGFLIRGSGFVDDIKLKE